MASAHLQQHTLQPCERSHKESQAPLSRCPRHLAARSHTQARTFRRCAQTFTLPLCLLFVVRSLHAWLGAVPTVAQPAARWGRRHACNLAELSCEAMQCSIRCRSSSWTTCHGMCWRSCCGTALHSARTCSDGWLTRSRRRRSCANGSRSATSWTRRNSTIRAP